MAFSFNGTDQCIKTASDVMSGDSYPITLYLRFSADRDDAGEALFALHSAEHGHSIRLGGNIAGKPVRAVSSYGAGPANDNGAYQVGVYASAGALFSSVTNRLVFVDQRTPITGTNPTTESVGNAKAYIATRPFEGAEGLFFDGAGAEAAIWSVALTAAEIASLAKGFSPRRIRPQSLVFYAPLIRNLQDVRRGLALTPVNGPTVVAHPRCYP